jgi:hypothetical protein
MDTQLPISSAPIVRLREEDMMIEDEFFHTSEWFLIFVGIQRCRLGLLPKVTVSG